MITMIYPFYLKKRKLKKLKNLQLTCMIKNKILFTKRFKTSIKSKISFGKGTYRVIKFNQKAWLKPYITMNTLLRKKQRMIFKKIHLN